MHDPKDVDRLIQVLFKNECLLPEPVKNELSPFREPRPRVGWHLFNGISGSIDEAVEVIELTEAVLTRLGPTAGVDSDDISLMLDKYEGSNDMSPIDFASAIMALIAEGQVEVDDE